MSYRVVIKPLAEIDLKEIFTWYEQEQMGLGDIFFEEFERSLAFLEANPYQYQVRYKKFRMVKIKRFPVCAHFTIDENNVFVHAVLSSSRNPEIWRKRS